MRLCYIGTWPSWLLHWTSSARLRCLVLAPLVGGLWQDVNSLTHDHQHNQVCHVWEAPQGVQLGLRAVCGDHAALPPGDCCQQVRQTHLCFTVKLKWLRVYDFYQTFILEFWTKGWSTLDLDLALNLDNMGPWAWIGSGIGPYWPSPGHWPGPWAWLLIAGSWPRLSGRVCPPEFWTRGWLTLAGVCARWRCFTACEGLQMRTRSGTPRLSKHCIVCKLYDHGSCMIYFL